MILNLKIHDHIKAFHVAVTATALGLFLFSSSGFAKNALSDIPSNRPATSGMSTVPSSAGVVDPYAYTEDTCHNGMDAFGNSCVSVKCPEGSHASGNQCVPNAGIGSTTEELHGPPNPDEVPTAGEGAVPVSAHENRSRSSGGSQVPEGVRGDQQCTDPDQNSGCVKPAQQAESASSDGENREANTQNTYANQDPSGASFGSQCETAHADTINSCDTEKGTSSATQLAEGMAIQLGSAGGNLVQACSTIGKAMAGANAGIAAYKMNCESSITSCVQACSSAASFAVANPSAASGFKKMQAECSSARRSLAGADQAMGNFISNAQMQSNVCNQLTGQSLEEICKANPAFLACASLTADCTNPQFAATNKICVCSKNPGDPMCAPAAKLTELASGRPLDSLNKNSMPDFGNIDNQELEIPQGNAPTAGGGGVDGQGNGGSGLGGGSSGGVSSDGGSKRRGGGEEKPGILAGFTSSASRLFNSLFGGGSPAPAARGNFSAPRGPAAQKKPDLRQFLPGGSMYRAAGMGGVTGPDGITGPQSDIWKKVNNRYNYIKDSLRP